MSRPALHARQLRDQLYQRFNGCCLGCGGMISHAGEWQIHHVIPRSEGGSDELDNLAALCLDCHTRAEDMRPMPQTLWALRRDLRRTLPEEGPQKLTEWPRTVSPCEDQSYDLDWHKWVYGGQANPFKDGKFIQHRVGCERCGAV